MKGSPLLIKVMIVFFVFPTFAWVGSATYGLILGLLLMLLPEAPQQALLQPILILAQIAGIVGALGVSWKIWPKASQTEVDEAL